MVRGGRRRHAESSSGERGEGRSSAEPSKRRARRRRTRTRWLRTRRRWTRTARGPRSVLGETTLPRVNSARGSARRMAPTAPTAPRVPTPTAPRVPTPTAPRVPSPSPPLISPSPSPAWITTIRIVLSRDRRSLSSVSAASRQKAMDDARAAQAAMLARATGSGDAAAANDPSEGYTGSCRCSCPPANGVGQCVNMRGVPEARCDSAQILDAARGFCPALGVVGECPAEHSSERTSREGSKREDERGGERERSHARRVLADDGADDHAGRRGRRRERENFPRRGSARRPRAVSPYPRIPRVRVFVVVGVRAEPRGRERGIVPVPAAAFPHVLVARRAMRRTRAVSRHETRSYGTEPRAPPPARSR